MKPLFTNKSNNTKQIAIIKDNEIISEDQEVAETLNTFFATVVKTLHIAENEHLSIQNEANDNSVDAAMNKYKSHPSILNIEKILVNVTQFSFTVASLNEVKIKIQQIDIKKVGTSENIPPKHFKQTTNICSPILMKLFNKCIWNNEFPDEL